MYTKKKYGGLTMIHWTRRELRFFIIWSIIVTALYELLGLHWLQVPWTALALIGTAVAFLIGFQSNAVYGRLWEARQIWGGIVNDSRVLGIMVLDMITNEYAKKPATDEELYQHKNEVLLRHIAWLTCLRHAMRELKPWESFRRNKHNKNWLDAINIPELKSTLEEDLKNYLSEKEHKHVRSQTNKCAAVMQLQSQHLRRLKERGLIWEFSFLELESKISELISHQGKSERIKNFPYPRQYATLGYDFINMFVWIIPLGIVPEFSKLGHSLTEQFPLIGAYFAWLAVPFTTLVSWIFNTMQRIGTVGENPFEGSANDVPISTMSRAIEIDLLEMLGYKKEDIPDPLPSYVNVQM